MRVQRTTASSSVYAVLLIALSACAVENGMDNPGITTGGVGGGGAGGGVTGGMSATGGTGGSAPVGGQGGSGGAVTGGMGGAAGDVSVTGGMGGMGGEGGAAGMTGGMGGMGGMGGEGGGPPVVDKGMGDGSDVITIGDSYMQFSGQADGLGIQWALESVSGRDYRNYGVSGTQVLTGEIPGQYDTAHAENPTIKTVVMTGGGNDILIGRLDCSIAWSDESCRPTIDMVSARLAELRTQMAADGVEDVILVSYGYPANEMLHNGLNYSRMILPEECLQTDVPACHYIDPVVELEGNIGVDGIHPTKAGYDILGQMVWDLMQERGMRR